MAGPPPVPAGAHLLVAASGGPDSTALLLGLADAGAGGRLAADRGPRRSRPPRAGEPQDRATVERLAATLGIGCVVRTVAVAAGHGARGAGPTRAPADPDGARRAAQRLARRARAHGRRSGRDHPAAARAWRWSGWAGGHAAAARPLPAAAAWSDPRRRASIPGRSRRRCRPRSHQRRPPPCAQPGAASRPSARWRPSSIPRWCPHWRPSRHGCATRTTT